MADDISREEGLKTLRKLPSLDQIPIHRAFNELEGERESARIKAEEKRDIIAMRKRWSAWILACIVIIVVFDISLVTALGFHLITFTEEYLAPTFIGESLLQIFILAYIVVTFLFETPKKPRSCHCEPRNAGRSNLINP